MMANAGGIRHGISSYFYGQFTLHSLHLWSLDSSADFLRISSSWTLLDKSHSFSTLCYNSLLVIEINKLIVWSINVLLLPSGSILSFSFLSSLLAWSLSLNIDWMSILSIFCRYLKSTFVIDLLACMPWDLIYKVCFYKLLPFYTHIICSRLSVSCHVFS